MINVFFLWNWRTDLGFKWKLLIMCCIPSILACLATFSPILVLHNVSLIGVIGIKKNRYDCNSLVVYMVNKERFSKKNIFASKKLFFQRVDIIISWFMRLSLRPTLSPIWSFCKYLHSFLPLHAIWNIKRHVQ